MYAREGVEKVLCVDIVVSLAAKNYLELLFVV